MNEKFINLNCAQMAAVSMWMLLSSLKLHCDLEYSGDEFDFFVIVHVHEGDDFDIPQGYYYTKKYIRNIDAAGNYPSFTTITYTFEY